MVALCFNVLLAIPAVAAGFALTNDGNKKLGQTLAVSITESLKKLKALENEEQGEELSFHRSMMQTLMSKQEVLASPEVAKVVAQASRLAEHQSVPKRDAICARDWSQPCPDGWEFVGSSACSAPTSYRGGCGILQNFGATNAQTKLNFASTCNAPWPCSGSDECPQGRDYESCPVGWELVGGGFCKQSSADRPKCASLFNFGDMEILEKQGLAKDCELQWACRSSCKRDYSAACPEGWQKKLNLCVAPATYAGDCSHSVDTTYMNDAQKKTFASNCVVKFPCQGTGTPQHSTTASQLGKMNLGNGPIQDGSEGIILEKKRMLHPGLPEEWFKMPSGPVDSKGGIHF